MQFVQDQQSPLEAPLSWLRQPRAGAQALRSQSAFRGLPREVAEPPQATPASLPQPVAWRWCGPDRHTRCSIKRRSRPSRPSRRLAPCCDHAHAADDQCCRRGRQEQGHEEAAPEQAKEQLRERCCKPSCRIRHGSGRRHRERSGRHGGCGGVHHDPEHGRVATHGPWCHGNPMAAGSSQFPEHQNACTTRHLVDAWTRIWHFRTGVSESLCQHNCRRPSHVWHVRACHGDRCGGRPSASASHSAGACPASTAMDVSEMAPATPSSPPTDME